MWTFIMKASTSRTWMRSFCSVPRRALSSFSSNSAAADYAVSDRRFHWQTQNSAGPNSKAGRRYLESRDNGWAFQLFVRPTQADAYQVCGPLRLESPDGIGGDRPMNIKWTLDVPLSPKLFAEFSVLRG